MPPASLSTMAVMKPGPMTVKKMSSGRGRRSTMRTGLVLPQHGDDVVGRDEPTSTPASSTTGSAIRLYLSTSSTTRAAPLRDGDGHDLVVSGQRPERRGDVGQQQARHGQRGRRAGRRASTRKSVGERVDVLGVLARSPSARRRPCAVSGTAMNSLFIMPPAEFSSNSSSSSTSVFSSASISSRMASDDSSAISASTSAASSGAISSTMSAARSASSDSRIDACVFGVVDLGQRVGGDLAVEGLEHRLASFVAQFLDDVGEVGGVDVLEPLHVDLEAQAPLRVRLDDVAELPADGVRRDARHRPADQARRDHALAQPAEDAAHAHVHLEHPQLVVAVDRLQLEGDVVDADDLPALGVDDLLVEQVPHHPEAPDVVVVGDQLLVAEVDAVEGDRWPPGRAGPSTSSIRRRPGTGRRGPCRRGATGRRRAPGRCGGPSGRRHACPSVR